LPPHMYVEINPKTANERGIKDGDMVAVISPRSLEYDDTPAYIIVRARVTPAVPEWLVFTPFHWAGQFQGQPYLDRFPVTDDMDTRPIVYGDSCNIVNPPGWDPETQMQATKSGICNVVRADKLQEFLSQYKDKIAKLKAELRKMKVME